MELRRKEVAEGKLDQFFWGLDFLINEVNSAETFVVCKGCNARVPYVL